MRKDEHILQCELVRWFSYKYPQYSKYLFAIPNGGARDVVTGSLLKAEGVKRGVPDLFLAIPSNNFHGLFIEVKTEKGRLSKYQIDMIIALQSKNYKCEVVRMIDDFMFVIEKYLTMDELYE
jgi:hypothetical protein